MSLIKKWNCEQEISRERSMQFHDIKFLRIVMKLNIFNKILFGLQLLLTIFVIGYLFLMDILPIQYLLLLSVILVLLLLIVLVLMLLKKKRGILGKIISILVSIAIIISSNFVIKGNNALSGVTAPTTQTHTYALVVMKDSELESIDDIDTQTILYNEAFADENFLKCKDALVQQKPNINWVTTTNIEEMITLLYDGEVDGVLLNEAFISSFEEVLDTFPTDTKIIWTYDLDQIVEDFSKEIDVTKDTFTVYISGIDTRGKVSTVSRSDVNMLVTVNPQTKQILMTSIPRDYYVKLNNLGKEDKLTHSGLGGIENSVKTIEDFMGIDVNYYARVNFTSLVKIVDALGGITVYSPVAFNTTSINVSFKQGNNYLDGEKALIFVRERKNLANGDNDRVANQQRVLKAMIDKMISPTIITNYTQILNAVQGSFETNMKSEDITSLIKMQINDMASWEFKSVQLKGKGVRQYGGAMMPDSYLYYMIPNLDSVNECSTLIQRMMNGEDIIDE